MGHQNPIQGSLLLFRLAHHLGKPKGELVVYDPFYCQGSIRTLYEKIGVTNFIHEKRDFYADVKAKRVPDYDILITNPPYSLNHKERIIAFVADSGKAWALLMPNYVANKSYFLDQVSSMGSSCESVGLSPQVSAFDSLNGALLSD